MNLSAATRALLLALPLAACASDRAQDGSHTAPEAQVETTTEPMVEATAKTSMPEVRYYVIADT